MIEATKFHYLSIGNNIQFPTVVDKGNFASETKRVFPILTTTDGTVKMHLLEFVKTKGQVKIVTRKALFMHKFADFEGVRQPDAATINLLNRAGFYFRLLRPSVLLGILNLRAPNKTDIQAPASGMQKQRD